MFSMHWALLLWEKFVELEGTPTFFFKIFQIRLRGVATGESPMAKGLKSPRTPIASQKNRPLRELQTTTPTTSKTSCIGFSRLPPTKVSYILFMLYF